MKKYLIYISVFGLVLGCTFLSVSSAAPDLTPPVYIEEDGTTQIIDFGDIGGVSPVPLGAFGVGDVNFNYRIDARDAREVLRFSAGLSSKIKAKWSYHADYNGDGKVSAKDARMILRVAAGLPAGR